MEYLARVYFILGPIDRLCLSTVACAWVLVFHRLKPVVLYKSPDGRTFMVELEHRMGQQQWLEGACLLLYE